MSVESKPSPARAAPAPSFVQLWWAPALLIAVSVLLELGGAPWREVLRYDRVAIAHGEVWRLLSGNFVHLGFVHLGLNAASLVLLVMLCPEGLSWRSWLMRVLVIGLGMSVGLFLFVPGLPTYVGLSGLIYGLFMLGLGRQAVQGDRIAWACLAFLAGRVIWELVIGAPASEENMIGGRVVAESHLSGIFSALIYGLVTGVFRRTGVVGIGENAARTTTDAAGQVSGSQERTSGEIE